MKYKVGDKIRTLLDGSKIKGLYETEIIFIDNDGLYLVIFEGGWSISDFYYGKVDKKYHSSNGWWVEEDHIKELIKASGDSNQNKILDEIFNPKAKVDEEHIKQGRWLSGIEKYNDENRPKTSPFKWL